MSSSAHLPGSLLRIKTSGSTGTPKTIERSPQSWEWSAQAEAELFAIGSVGERFAVIGSPTHSLWAYVEFRARSRNAEFIGLEPGQLAAAALFEQLRAYDPSCLYAVPDLLVGLLGQGSAQQAFGLPNLKRLLLGGGPWQPSFQAVIESFAPNANVHLFYGTAEASFIGHCQPHQWPWYRPFPGVRLRLDPEQSGALWVSSPYVYSPSDVQPSSHNKEWVATSDLAELRYSARFSTRLDSPSEQGRKDGYGATREHGHGSAREDGHGATREHGHGSAREREIDECIEEGIEEGIEFRLVGRVGRQVRYRGLDISPEAIEELIAQLWPETQAAVFVSDAPSVSYAQSAFGARSHDEAELTIQGPSVARARLRVSLVYCGPAQGVDAQSCLKEALRREFPQLPMLEGIHRIPQWPRLASGKTDFQALQAHAWRSSE